MNYSIDTNYLSQPAGRFPRGTIPRPGAASNSFLDTTLQLYKAERGGAAAPVNEPNLSTDAYRQGFWEKISQMPLSPTRQMESISIQISDEAFERMKSDPSYEEWVLNDLRTALSQSNPWVPACGGGYSVFYIGASKEDCRAEGWYPGYQGGQGAALFEEKNKDSFWEQRVARHKEFMELEQKAAAQRRWDNGTISAAQLLFNLL